MTRLSIEAKVGFFVVLGILILAYMSMKVGKLPYGPDQGYEVYGLFDSAEGLVKGVSVEIAGVDVGRVKEISLEKGKAKVTLQINTDIQVGKNVVAAIRTEGVLGDKYLELILDPSDTSTLEPGTKITKTVSPPNIDSLLKQIGSIGEDIKKMTGAFSGALSDGTDEGALKSIVDNLKELTQALNETISKNRENIDRTLDNFSSFSQDLRNMSDDNKDSFTEIIENFRQASQQLQTAIASITVITNKINKGEGTLGRLINEDDTVESMNETLVALKEIADKVNRGEGTIGRLVNDEETVEKLNSTLSNVNDYLEKEQRFQTYVDYRGEYLFDDDDVKSYLSLRIQPKEDKYYMLGIVDDPSGKESETTYITTDGSGNTTTSTTKEIQKDKVKFSAQIAKRYYDLGLRGGIFENKGGVALDYFLFDDRVTLSLEAFDFDDDDGTHLKFRTDYTPFHYVYITGGFDDFISDDGSEAFFLGFGLRFSDQDLKTLLSGAPIPQ